MPNWCQNNLTIRGPESLITKIVEVVKPDNDAAGSALSLDKMAPMPSEKDSDDGWWNWRIQNWGTKWDVDATLIHQSTEELIYTFDSAWAPPTEAIATFAGGFPGVMFELAYCEGGADYGGIFVAETSEEGTVSIHHEDLSYVEAYEYMFGEPPEDFESEELVEEEQATYGDATQQPEQPEQPEGTNAGNDLPTE